MNPQSQQEQELLDAAQSMANAHRPGYRLASVTVRLEAPGCAAVDVSVINAKPIRSTLAEAALQAMRIAGGPIRSKELAKAIGCKPGSHLRATLSGLTNEGVVAKVKGGYALASASEVFCR